MFCYCMDVFSKFLTDKEYLTVFPPILEKLCPIRSIIGLSHGLSNVSHKSNPATFRDVMTVLSWLKQVAEQGFTTAICDSLKADEMDADSVQLYEDFTKACMSLPEKIMNCCAKALTEEHFKYITLIKTVFQNQMLQGIQESLFIAHKTPTANLKTVSELVSAGRNVKMNSNDTLLGLLMQWISEIEDFDTRWKELMRVIFLVPTTLGVQVHEALLTAVFMGAKDDHTVARCIDTDRLTGTIRRVVMVKLPFQRNLKPRIIKIVINFIHRTSEGLGIELLNTAIKIWSDRNFARKTPETQERHIVRIIVYSIHLFKKNDPTVIDWNELFMISMEGIHVRSKLLPVYVQGALFINFALGQLAMGELPKDGEEHPSPPEFEKTEWTDELTALLEHGMERRGKKTKPVVVVAPEDSDDEVDPNFVETRVGESVGALDIMSEDEEVRSTEEEDPLRIGSLGSLASGVSLDNNPRIPFGSHGEVGAPGPLLGVIEEQRLSFDSSDEEDLPATNAERLQEVESPSETARRRIQLDSDDDDEDFPDYEVDETEKQFRKMEVGEEPKPKVSPPNYLADAYEMLLEKENYAIFEAAFFNIKALINRKAMGLVQYAEHIFVRVIHLQNVFAIKDFEEKANEIATACITHRPEIVPALVRLLIAPGQSYPIQQRLLNCIHKAADEMGALDRRNEKFVLHQENVVGGMTMQQVGFDPQQEQIRSFAHFAGVGRSGFPRGIPLGRVEAERRIAANTRRLGTTRERPRAGVVNRLAKAAKYMFYPLLVLPRGEHVRLLGEDSDLLAYIIMVASMIYVRCGVNPAVSKMSIELINYCQPHRFSENPKLRTACLAAYLNVLALIPGEILTDLFSVETRQEWLFWVHSVTNNHTSGELEHGMALQIESHLRRNLVDFEPLSYVLPKLNDV
uniref:Telomere length regulation protein conserved domain-containing protein n=1 Tax=Caenorhabditis brenneri TaxID=135651 RepID=B6VBE2_CAEBE|nr:hypothetical protein Cbre_JD07.002 [Caenorhabditis brenneri]